MGGGTTAMTDETISGFVGLVLIPDAPSIDAARALAKALVPPDAEQTVASGDLPHVTVMQCPLREAPRAHVASFVDQLRRQLLGRTLPLNRVIPFPGGFLFWTVDPDSPERQLLQSVHENALTLGDGFLDPITHAAIVEGTVKATGNDEQLVGNARRYGYAFAKERYVPHITLGFASRASFAPRDHVFAMRVERAALVRLGRLGRVEEILL